MSLWRRLISRGPETAPGSQSPPAPEAHVAHWAGLRQTAFALWAGILDAVDLDLRTGTVLLKTHVVNGSLETHAEIECRGVTEFSMKTDIPWPWTYPEITEVWAATTAERARLVITLWAEPSELAIEAATITIAGQRLQSPFEDVARTLT